MSLLGFHDAYLRRSIDNVTAADDPYSLEILWHSAFILMSADLNRLELALVSGVTTAPRSREELGTI